MNKKEEIDRRVKFVKIRISAKEKNILQARAGLNHKGDVSKYIRARLRFDE